MKQLPEEAPKPRERQARLPKKARTMKPDDYLDVDDIQTANCVCSFGRTQGWKMVRRSGEKCVRVWRLS